MTIEEILKLAREADQREWCQDYCYSTIRHVIRNCDIECLTHEWRESECGIFGKYDGPYIAAVCPKNIIPLLEELAAYRKSEAMNKEGV